MSARPQEEVNPFAAPGAADESPPLFGKSDQELRHEYFGAILLAIASGALACVFMLASTRYPSSSVGEVTQALSRWVSLTLAVVSLVFVMITLRAAASRIWRLLRLIWSLRR